jgi:O-antigen ligase
LGKTQNAVRKIFWYVSAGVFVVGNVAAFSRGGFVGLLAVTIYLIYGSKRRISTLFFLGCFSLVVYLFAPSSYWGEMQTITDENVDKGTGKERWDSWKCGWEMFLDHPIIGVGARNFGVWLRDYWPGDRNPDKMWGRVAHSFYFTVLPEMGLLGTYLVCGMLYGCYKDHRYTQDLQKRKENLLSGHSSDRKASEAI